MLVGRVGSRIDSRKLTALDVQEGIGAHGEAAVRASVVPVQHLQVCAEDVLPEVFLRYRGVLLPVSALELGEGEGDLGLLGGRGAWGNAIMGSFDRRARRFGCGQGEHSR